MSRTFSAVLVLVGAFLLSGRAPAADAEEVAKLKREIEQLKKEIEQLKKENEQLKAGGSKGATTKPAAEVFGVGTKLVGTVTKWVAGGKREVVGDDVELEITKRSGTEFTAEYWADNRKFGMEVEGAIEGGVVRFKTTKSLTDAKLNLVSLHTFAGRFDNGVFTGKSSKKGDESYRGDWKLKLKKE